MSDVIAALQPRPATQPNLIDELAELSSPHCLFMNPHRDLLLEQVRSVDNVLPNHFRDGCAPVTRPDHRDA